MLKTAKSNQKAIYALCLSFLVGLLAVFGLGWHLNAVLRSYLLALMAVILFAASVHLLGKRKDAHFARGMLARSIIIEIICYGLIIYFLGLFLGFMRGYAINTPYKFFANLLPTLISTICVELMRFVLVAPVHHSKPSAVVLTTLTIATYLLTELSASIPQNSEQLFIFTCTTLLPIIARESLSSFIVYRIGLLPDLIYRLTMILYPYLLPIVPNLGDYLYSVANIVLPFVIFLSVVKYSKNDEKDRQSLKISYKFIIIPTFAVIAVLAALTSGIFKHQLIAVASNSMNPTYYRGDAVLIEKIDASDIQVGDILVFRKDNRIVTHRAVDVIQRDGGYYFTTRGDANADPDATEVSDRQVIGRVIMVGKYIGYPTVWLNEVFNRG